MWNVVFLQRDSFLSGCVWFGEFGSGGEIGMKGKEEKVILKNDLKTSGSKVKLNLYIGSRIENSKYQEVEQKQTDH